MQFSYSRVDLYDRCPYHFKLRYIDKLTELPNLTANNPLIIGNAMHTGIEKGYDVMKSEYLNSYPIMTDDHINELIKMEIMLPKVREFLSQFDGMDIINEYEIDLPEFRGFVDLIVTDPQTGESLVIDFKYSNSIEAYKKSGQMHIYKHYLDELGFNVTRLGYLFVEKTNIRPKNGEDMYQFRKRLAEVVGQAGVTYVPIEYDERKVLEFEWAMSAINAHIEHQNEWDMNVSDCFACSAINAKKSGRYTVLTPPDFLDAIQNENGEILMVLPKNERRDVNKVSKRILWEYGAPFSGKTWFANSFPDVLMLNTDGNIKFIDAPFINIADKVSKTGRLTKTELAWDILDEAISQLETSDHGFKTIVADLLEDLYTAARYKVYEELDISHESDNSFKAWDIVTTKFLSMIKRIINLDVENIIFISHEDITKDITSRAGDKVTNIQPNIREKVALKVAGMVDIVGRVVADDDERKLVFKSKRYVFSGGRIPNMPLDEIELDYDAFVKIYEMANKKLNGRVAKVAKPVTEQTTAPADVSDISDAEQVELTEEKPKRARRKKADDSEPKTAEPLSEEEAEDIQGAEHTNEPEGTEESLPRRRRSRSDSETELEDTEVDTTEPVEETKPTRARRSRKSAVVDETPPGEGDDNENEIDEDTESKQADAETEAKPRRRRRSRA